MRPIRKVSRCSAYQLRIETRALDPSTWMRRSSFALGTTMVDHLRRWMSRWTLTPIGLVPCRQDEWTSNPLRPDKLFFFCASLWHLRPLDYFGFWRSTFRGCD